MSEPQLVSSGDSTDDENQRIQLHQQVEELRGFNEALLAENEMFEQFIIHSDKQNQKFSVDPQRNDKLKKGSSIRSISQSRELTIEQKLYVSETAIKEAQKDLEQLRERNMKTWDHYVSTLEEAKLCLEEIRKGKKEFEQKLLRRANEKRLEMKEPEKLLLYIVDKSKTTKIEMLSIKNSVLKGLKNKLKHDFQQKKENLKIYYEKSVLFQGWSKQKREKPLGELLGDYVKTQHVITVHKEKQKGVTAEHTKAEQGRLKAGNLNRRLRSQMENYEVPEVKEYLEARRRYKKLQQDIRIWERKVKIAQMIL
ncbi:coiled-coil domain-containing protein 113-like [Takifugu rubripes]|uniref:coiled-coil domain-containing protein 113-like n=1 Tax=Takifugu rubripes TaxID=31033 RepID=UPI00114588FB|nr:coiled-coil domain-containing protein 113-like [Takifugu rubripes]